VAEEEVDGADDLSLVGVDAHHVVEADLELARAVQDVRRAARPEEGADDDDAHHEQQQDGRQQGHDGVGDVREVEQHVAREVRKSSQASGMSSRTASLRSRALRRASRVRATSASLPARPGERMVERELFSTDGFTGAVGHQPSGMRRWHRRHQGRLGHVSSAHLPSRRIAFHRRRRSAEFIPNPP